MVRTHVVTLIVAIGIGAQSYPTDEFDLSFQPWERRLTPAACPSLSSLYEQNNNAPVCGTTTITETTTRVTTTETATTTTSVTATETTATTTATTTTKATTTETTSTSVTTVSSTATSVTTTETTTPAPPCKLCESYPMTPSGQTINPNEQLEVSVDTSPCLTSSGNMTFKCPANNNVLNGPPGIVQGSLPIIQCMVCSITIAEDSNSEEGVYSGTVSWGPNVLSNAVNESIIAKYKLYLVDEGGFKVGNALAETSKSSGESDCCETDKYQADVQNVNVAGIKKFMVVPVDSDGYELKLGRLSAQISDSSYTDTTTTVVTTNRPGSANLAKHPKVGLTSGVILAGAILTIVHSVATPFQ